MHANFVQHPSACATVSDGRQKGLWCARGLTEGGSSSGGSPSALGRMQCNMTAKPASRFTCG